MSSIAPPAPLTALSADTRVLLAAIREALTVPSAPPTVARSEREHKLSDRISAVNAVITNVLHGGMDEPPTDGEWWAEHLHSLVASLDATTQGQVTRG